MGDYAVIKNNIVSNIIVAESKEIAENVTELECIEINSSVDRISVGWSYDGINFTAPATE